MCQFYLFFSYPSKFLFDKRSIVKRKPSIVRNCDDQFPNYIYSRLLILQSPRCTLLATTDPLRSALETIRSPKIYLPRILLDSLSSQNKFQNFTHLESEKHLFPQSINDLQLHDKNFHRNFCILHRNTSQIKITTVKISKQIKLFKNIWWTQIPSSFKQTSLISRC